MKEVVGKGMMTNENLVLLTRITRMRSEKLFHQEGPSQTDTQTFFLDIFFLQ
jgi:hypothetical protein